MKFQLDTTNKTIKVEEKIKLSELIETLEKMFPKEEWKEFALEISTIVNTTVVINKSVQKDCPEIKWGIYPNQYRYTTPEYYFGYNGITRNNVLEI